MGRARKWCFTVNNYDERDLSKVKEMCEKDTFCYIYAKEEGASKTPHIQGYVHFKKRFTLTTMKKWVPRAHFEIAEGTDQQNKKYCEKEGNVVECEGDFGKVHKKKNENIKIIIERIMNNEELKDILNDSDLQNTYTHHAKKIKDMIELKKKWKEVDEITKEYEGIEWKDWQQKLLKEIEGEPDKRKIIFYVDYKGNNGKIFLSRYINTKPNTLVIENSKSENLKYIWNGEKVVIIDLTRANEEYINYGAIESIKNGMVFSTKYEPKVKMHKIPHVVVMMNEDPDKKKLSEDRWDIRKLSEEEEDEVVKEASNMLTDFVNAIDLAIVYILFIVFNLSGYLYHCLQTLYTLYGFPIFRVCLHFYLFLALVYCLFIVYIL